MYTKSFSLSVGWLPKTRRKKATIQGHQILGCKYTPAKGMESCKKMNNVRLSHCNTLLFTTTTTTTATTATSSSTSSWDPIVGNKLFHWSIDSKQLD